MVRNNLKVEVHLKQAEEKLFKVTEEFKQVFYMLKAQVRQGEVVEKSQHIALQYLNLNLFSV